MANALQSIPTEAEPDWALAVAIQQELRQSFLAPALN
jgi:hypothetical protein